MNLEKQLLVAKQIHKAVQLTIENTELTESEMLEVADVYEGWATDKAYKTGKVLKYGVNIDNETQLYQVLQDHTSQADWTPDKTPSLYKAIGIGGDGVAIWVQPLGQSDAYQKGDRVHYPTEADPIYVSDVDNNVWAPDVYGWTQEA